MKEKELEKEKTEKAVSEEKETKETAASEKENKETSEKEEKASLSPIPGASCPSGTVDFVLTAA